MAEVNIVVDAELGQDESGLRDLVFVDDAAFEFVGGGTAVNCY